MAYALQVGERAMHCGSAKCQAIEELHMIKELHIK